MCKWTSAPFPPYDPSDGIWFGPTNRFNMLYILYEFETINYKTIVSCVLLSYSYFITTKLGSMAAHTMSVDSRNNESHATTMAIQHFTHNATVWFDFDLKTYWLILCTRIKYQSNKLWSPRITWADDIQYSMKAINCQTWSGMRNICIHIFWWFVNRIFIRKHWNGNALKFQIKNKSNWNGLKHEHNIKLPHLIRSLHLSITKCISLNFESIFETYFFSTVIEFQHWLCVWLAAVAWQLNFPPYEC